MRIVENRYHFSIEEILPKDVIVGFTKPIIKKNLNIDKIDLNNSFKVASLKQLHSTKINVVKDEGLYAGDGLITKSNKLLLVVKTADCLPIFLYSKLKNLIGLVHMGWRGAINGILDNLPQNLSSFKVIAGVGLRSCCYKVGREFLKYKEILPFLIKKDNVLYFDPIRFLIEKLKLKGLKEENFFDIGICSFCFPYKFYSFRRNNTNYRTLSFITKNKACS
ncbi:MAG: polyphenol oxidase family protein [Candidatus Omnitrophica bacterium]|nr:polyphenol oxidase family protein [Candidatus Omnitrophota bacterium]